MHSTKVNATSDFLRIQRGTNGSVRARIESSTVSAHGMSFAMPVSVERVHLWRRFAVVLAVFAGVAVMSLMMASVTIQSIGQGVERPLATPLTDPTTARRLDRSDIVYVGGFRLPAEEMDGASFDFGGSPIAYNPGSDSLFVGTRGSKVAEVTIPSPVNSSRVDDLPFARYLQPFRDPTEGRIREVANEGAYVSGLLVYQGRLYGSGVIYYDAEHAQEYTHFSRSLRLSDDNVKGMVRVGEKGKAGFVSGYLAAVPAEWQSAIGGPAITGQCCIPIVGRTSWGPAAFAWNPADLGAVSPVPARPLVYYTSDHPTLGSWEGSNATYGGTIQMGGVVIAGRTALFVGRNGLGPFCYGTGTADQARANAHATEAERYCYDPVSSDKGQHAYPYRNQFWAYDLTDLAQVSARKKDPWQVTPYGVWAFDLPTPEATKVVGGVGFDAARRLLYVSQMSADRDGYAYRPVIHVFRIL